LFSSFNFDGRYVLFFFLFFFSVLYILYIYIYFFINSDTYCHFISSDVTH